jgi:DNA polymerase-1
MRVIVDHENKAGVLAHLCSLNSSVIALDTETYGLKWSDKLFALQLAVRDEDLYYFNFHEYNDGSPVLDRSIFQELNKLWMNSSHRWIMANAKFDLRKIAIEGVQLNGEIYDVLLMDRLRYNRHFSYSLDACLKRIGSSKNDEVKTWIAVNKAYTTHSVDGKKTKEKDLHFDRVPFSIMSSYGFDDVESTLYLYQDQSNYFMSEEGKAQIDLVHSNMELTKTVFLMEQKGIQLDVPYCKRMLEKEQHLAMDKADKIEQMTQQKFKAGPKWLKEVLNAQGIVLEVSDKGNPILDKNALKAMPNAVAHYVMEMRDHEKRASTYSTLLRFVDSYGVLHTNYRLNGTDTLRFSSSDPNLQNIEACQKSNLETTRTAFVPRPHHFFVSIDYKTMEYRLCADIAGEHGWIKAINEGADPHQWVADMMEVGRKEAKTLNFMLLYGGGLAKLATSLFDVKTDENTLNAICKIHIYNSKKVTLIEHELVAKVPHELLMSEIEHLGKADKLKKKYFQSLPAVASFTKQVQDVAIARGFVRNQYGARYHIDKPMFAYKLPNHLIQGTGACIIRSAMNKIEYQLEGMKSKMLLQIHDELLFEIHKDEAFIVTTLRDIMEREYKSINGMQLKCDVEYSMDNWNANNFKQWSDYDGHKES